MDRKPPYKHPVRGHIRGGKYVEHYERGKGHPREKNMGKVKPRGRSTYQVVFMFPSGGREQYNASGTASGALRSALASIQRGEVPVKAILRRL